MRWTPVSYLIIFVSIEIPLQSDNPTGNTINTLGVYLLISLLFVTAAMLEFSGMMFLQRKNELRKSIDVSILGHSLRRGSFEMKEMTTKIDGISMILFLMAYLLFNVAYWIIILIPAKNNKVEIWKQHSISFVFDVVSFIQCCLLDNYSNSSQKW